MAEPEEVVVWSDQRGSFDHCSLALELECHSRHYHLQLGPKNQHYLYIHRKIINFNKLSASKLTHLDFVHREI